MVTSNNYYITDSHFIKSSLLKPIIESKTQGKNILWVKKEKTILNFKRQKLLNFFHVCKANQCTGFYIIGTSVM